MKRITILLVFVAITIGVYLSIHSSITRESRAALKADCPELVWLKREYALSDQQYQKVVELHDLHDVRCKEYCQALSSKQKHLLDVIKSESADGDSFQKALQVWREERMRSQDYIFKHMFDVSAEMDNEQGVRYREHVYKFLILPGRTPHMDARGEYNSQLIQHLKK